MAEKLDGDRVLNYRSPHAGVVAPFGMFFLSFLALLPFHVFLYIASHKGKGAEALPLLGCLICVAVSLVLGGAAVFIAFRRRQLRFWASVGLASSLLHGLLFFVAAPRIIQAGSNRVPCASHLNHIGMAIMLYANDHNGQLPPSLEDLVFSEDLHPSALVCVNGPETPAKGPTPAELRASFRQHGHVSFVYVRTTRRISELNADDVLAYEPLQYHEAGSNVLFGDGHVQWLTADEFKKLMAARERASTQPTTRPESQVGP